MKQQPERRKIATNRRDERGSSLVEILVALGIVLVVSGGMATLFGVSRKTNDINAINVQLLNSARAKVEQIQGMPYSQVGIQATTGTSGPGYFVNDPIYNEVYNAANGDIPLSDTVTLRDGVQVTRTVTVAAVDDPIDGTGINDLDDVSDPNTNSIMDYKLLTITVSATVSGVVVRQKLTTMLQGTLPNEEDGATGVDEPDVAAPPPTKAAKAPKKVAAPKVVTPPAGCDTPAAGVAKRPGKKGASDSGGC